MSDDAYLFLLPERHPGLGAALGAVGGLECAETPAVRAWLDAHEVSGSSERVRILPSEAKLFIPADAERLPVPLTEEETVRVRQQGAPRSVTDMEAELLEFRDTTQDWEALVHRALAAGVPAPRIAQLTGLPAEDIARLTV